jgi:polyketide cyclase/dehydrase/lipid transport protein
MTRYLVHVRTPMAPAEAFAYMADLTNFAEWDPGVDRVDQVQGDGPGPDTSFDVAVKALGRSMTLRYDIISYDASGSVVAFAENRVLSSLDTVTVEQDESGSGSVVTYDAVLKLKGLLGLADPLLGLSFKRIGDRAAAGLVSALSGERVSEPAS